MFNNQPETWVVDAICIDEITTNSISMPSYKLHYNGENHTGSVHKIIEWEYKIGATKRELLESFLSEND